MRTVVSSLVLLFLLFLLVVSSVTAHYPWWWDRHDSYVSTSRRPTESLAVIRSIRRRRQRRQPSSSIPLSNESFPTIHKSVTLSTVQSHVDHVLNSLRGGGAGGGTSAPFNTPWISNGLALLYLIQGYLITVTPQECLDLCLDQVSSKFMSTPMVLFQTKLLGMFMLNIGILVYCLRIPQTSLDTALACVGLSTSLLYLAETVRQTPKTIGITVMEGWYVTFAMHGLLLYTGLVVPDWAVTMYTVYVGFLATSAVANLLAPKVVQSAYGIIAPATELESFQTMFVSYWSLALSVLIYVLLQNTTTDRVGAGTAADVVYKAFGYSSIPIAAAVLKEHFLTDRGTKNGIKRESQVFWFILLAVHIYVSSD